MVLFLDGLDEVVDLVPQTGKLRDRTAGDAGHGVGFQHPEMGINGRADSQPQARPLIVRELLWRYDWGRCVRRFLRLPATGARVFRSSQIRSRLRAALVYRIVANGHGMSPG